MSCYGYQRKTTPYLDRFSSENVLFKNAFSPAMWTIPSHASLFTGTYPSMHGASNLHRYLDTTLLTLSEVLSSNGYDTALFSNNYFLSLKDFGLSRGFNISKGQGYPKSKCKRLILKGKARLTRLLDSGALVTSIFVKDFLNKRRKAEKPFFLFLNYMEAHAPYERVPKKFLKYFVDKQGRRRIKSTNQDRQKYLTRSIHMSEDDFRLLRSIYDSQIYYLDFRLKELSEILKRYGFLDNTILIITADHGDLIGEHCLLHHSYALYEELIKVPLILKLPGNMQQGMQIEAQVSTIDIFPTIIHLLGIRNDVLQDQLQGTVLPLTEREQGSKYVFSECERPKNEFKDTYPEFDFSIYDRQLLSIRSKRFKFIWSSNGQHELYNIENDPAEQFNLITKLPKIAKDLENHLSKWYSSFQKHSLTEEKAADLQPDVQQHLKALGYF